MVAVRTCPECGQDLQGDVTNCPGCGSQVQEQGQRSPALGIAAMVCGGIAIFLAPILLGPIGIGLGIGAKVREERWSTAAIVVPIVGMLLGFAVAYFFFRAATSQ